ncbi:MULTISPECIES: Crp/Fnr family transcriptional regulator [unclassified Cupriavidus]|uniref:Crp/Fnr family transcriptional regulator n=2 Tax=Cupriavidus TaxID=106589 RepID=UPI0006842524|nr:MULTISPECIES: Crp/Fnr family transcriptional regulator [unclassified Cupriavidus]
MPKEVITMGEAINLEALSLFRGVDAAVVAQLRAAATLRCLRKGEYLFRGGEACAGLYIVVEGLLKLALQPPAGDESTGERAIEVFGPGAAFGEDLLCLDVPGRMACQAQTRTLVLQIGKAALWQAVMQEPLLAAQLLRNLSGRLHGLMRDIEAISLQSALQRVAGFLREQAFATRRTWLACTQRVIASKLGITPETLSRVMHRFCAERLVRIERGKIYLIDPDGLARQAGAGELAVA